MRDDNRNLRHLARQMRRAPTPAEEAVWKLVRNRRLTDFKFRRQHPLGRYILDCYCPTARVVVELDGDTHATPEGRASDAERDRYLQVRGILVLRFWNTEIADNPDGVAQRIAEVCAARMQCRTGVGDTGMRIRHCDGGVQ